MNYHIYECDRCHTQEKSADLPITWAAIKIITGRACYDEREKDFSLCSICSSGVQNFVGNKNIELINTAYYTSVHNADLKDMKQKAGLADADADEITAVIR
jgi:hypothetical protein